MLKCTKCNFLKDESQFYKNKRYISGYMTWCKQCHYDYYHKDPENKAKLKQAIKQWSVDNKDYLKEYSRDYHLNNLERNHNRTNARSRERWATDPAYRKRKNRQSQIKSQKRRARIKVADELTLKQWEEICFKYHNICLCCGKVKKLTVDHIIPLSRGGTHTANNVQPLCALCNSRKATVAVDYRYSQR